MTNQVNKAPAGATHRYEHGGFISWYREVDGKLFVWRDGSWHAASFMTIDKLMGNCMLGRVIYLPMEQGSISSGISCSEAAAGLKAFTVKATDTIDWSAAPEGATHHIGGDKLECPWHQNLSHIRYWNGEEWIKRSAFRTTKEAMEKGFIVVARPEHLGWAPTLPVEHIKFTFHVMGSEEVKPVTVTNETVQLEQPGVVAGTGAGVSLDRPPRGVFKKQQDDYFAGKFDPVSATESAFLIGRVIDLLRTSVDHFSADELADLNELTGAELTKRDERVCGGQKYIDAHWFERGELPPIGCECDIRHACWPSDKFESVRILAITEEYLIVKAGYGEQHFLIKDISFRPIRTDADRLKDLLAQAGITTCIDQAADAILAAGFKRGGAA